jgi:uncharacterized protein YndB with AHSA1/START domain
MPRITRTITTDGSRDAVFAYLADFSHAAQWDPGTEKSTPRHPDGPSLGQVYDLIVTWGNRTLPMVYETTELVHGERVTFVGDGSTTRAVDTLTFTDLPDGGTEVTYVADITLKWPYRVAEPFLGKKFTELGDEAEESLTRVLASL